MKWKCHYCGNDFEIKSGALHRATEKGLNVYCNRTCSGLGRRTNKTDEQKKKDKSEYDKQFREKNRERLKKEKHEYFKRTYDKEQAALVRKKNMPRHVEYCRRPEYRKWKKEYDKIYLAKKQFGEFGEAALALLELEKELERKSPEMLSVKFQNGTVNKSQKRKKQWRKQRIQN
jgi:hypothetical protein